MKSLKDLKGEPGFVSREAQKKGRKAPFSKAERLGQEPFYNEEHEGLEGANQEPEKISPRRTRRGTKGKPFVLLVFCFP